jgi:hypothetical protein
VEGGLIEEDTFGRCHANNGGFLNYNTRRERVFGEDAKSPACNPGDIERWMWHGIAT